MSKLRVLVCGGRDFRNAKVLSAVLSDLHFHGPGVEAVIHGAARGADTLATEWARRVGGVVVQSFPANWSLGRKAGPIRNQQMLDMGKPDRVIAFPGGRGTADMVRRAKAAGITVDEIFCPNEATA